MSPGRRSRGIVVRLVVLCSLTAVGACARPVEGAPIPGRGVPLPASADELGDLIVTEVPSGLPRLSDGDLTPPAGAKRVEDVAAYADDPVRERAVLEDYGYRHGWERFWGRKSGPVTVVTAAIANGGAVMRPQVVERVKGPGGGTVMRLRPDELNRAMSPRTALEVTQMMEAVVQGGTGTAAQLPGVSVAGKTGTAETGVAGRNNAWFIAFAPSDKPRVAIAVVVENTNSTGGEVAAPIARSVLQALVPETSNSVRSG